MKHWIQSNKTYPVRFGIKMLMDFYLDKSFYPEYLDWVADITSEEYYVKMMPAWYFATALTKQYETGRPFIESYRLELWVHNKTIQKAIESHRITDEQKVYLRSMELTAVRRITEE